MNKIGRVVTELRDEKWRWNLVSLCDISHNLHDVKIEHEGQQKLVSDMFGAISAFEMKLKQFRKQLENVNQS
jgi:archaellum component FlaC